MIKKKKKRQSAGEVFPPLKCQNYKFKRNNNKRREKLFHKANS